MTTEALVELTEAPSKPMPEMAAPKIANVDGRLGSDFKNQIVSWIGWPWKRRLASAALLIPKIRHYEKALPQQEPRRLKTSRNPIAWLGAGRSQPRQAHP